MTSFVVALVVCLFVVLLIHRSIVSTRTYALVLALSREDAVEVVENCFERVAWVNTTGPGLINKARVNDSARTVIVSIDVIDRLSECEIRAWVSERKAIAGLTFSLGVLKPTQLRVRLRRHPAFVREVDRPG
jgi:hypothetical protein